MCVGLSKFSDLDGRMDDGQQSAAATFGFGHKGYSCRDGFCPSRSRWNLFLGGSCLRGSFLGRSSLGFSLPEILLAMAIMLLLAAFAWPSYRGYMVRGQRHLATLHLSAVMVALEHAAVSTGSYEHLHLSQFTAQQTLPASLKRSYRFSLQLADSGQHYELLATPIGKQAVWDNDCGTLKLDDRARRQVTGEGGAEQCWR